MTIVGIHYTTNAQGQRLTTLHVTDSFADYYKNREAGRACDGQRVESIYVGTLDCSGLKVGMNVDISYDKAVTTSHGTFSPIKRIDIIK